MQYFISEDGQTLYIVESGSIRVARKVGAQFAASTQRTYGKPELNFSTKPRELLNFDDAPPRKRRGGPRPCSICGLSGHNKRTCPKKSNVLADAGHEEQELVMSIRDLYITEKLDARTICERIPGLTLPRFNELVVKHGITRE